MKKVIRSIGLMVVVVEDVMVMYVKKKKAESECVIAMKRRTDELLME